jgi:hypothetical protein
MQSGGSASPSVVRRAGRPARRSAPRRDTTRATAVVVVVVEGTPPAVATTAEGDRTPPAVAATLPVAADTLLAVVAVIPAARVRCIRQHAPNAAGTRKFPSSLARTSRSTAGSASSYDGRQRRRVTTTTRTSNSPRGAANWPPLFHLVDTRLLKPEACGNSTGVPTVPVWRQCAFRSEAHAHR